MLVCLDLDNTLNDRQAAVEAWVDEFVAERELPATEREWLLDLDQDGYRDRFEAFTEIRQRYGIEAGVDDLVAAYRERVIALARPVAGASECLAELRAGGWSIAIVTNGSSAQQHRKIDLLGWRDAVDAVVVSGDLDIKKPDPRIFEHAAALVGEPRDGAWMVGDAMLHDIVGAARCGMRTAWIRRARSWDPALEVEPDLIVDELAGLATKLAAV